MKNYLLLFSFSFFFSLVHAQEVYFDCEQAEPDQPCGLSFDNSTIEFEDVLWVTFIAGSSTIFIDTDYECEDINPF